MPPIKLLVLFNEHEMHIETLIGFKTVTVNVRDMVHHKEKKCRRQSAFM